MNEIKCPKCGEVFEIDEASYSSIAKQVRDSEFEKLVREKEAHYEKEKSSALENLKLQMEMEIQKLNNTISKNETEKQSAVLLAVQQKEKELSEKEKELTALKGQIEAERMNFQLQEKSKDDMYAQQLKFKDDQIAQIKDFKSKLSVKLVGETLEQHCEIEFNKLRSLGFQNAYFEKDNDASTGSKGDYIFRDFEDDGTEILSIMFEMKNESETTATKRKNEDFFKELDKDRKEKKCEYAVLVTLLEGDSELYNSGIVDVSHKYPKMYVVRPQFFISIITVLKNAAMKALEYKRQLAVMKSQNIDITNFEQNLSDFKQKISRNYNLAGQNFRNAIDEIDKSIKHLEGIKEALIKSIEQLRYANDKAEDLSIKKLTKDSPSLRAQFDALKK